MKAFDNSAIRIRAEQLTNARTRFQQGVRQAVAAQWTDELEPLEYYAGLALDAASKGLGIALECEGLPPDWKAPSTILLTDAEDRELAELQESTWRDGMLRAAPSSEVVDRLFDATLDFLAIKVAAESPSMPDCCSAGALREQRRAWSLARRANRRP